MPMSTRVFSPDDSMSLPEPIEGVPEKSSRVPEKSRNAVQPGKTFAADFADEDHENFAGFKGENIADANEGFADANFTGSGGIDEPDYSEANFPDEKINGTLFEFPRRKN